MPHAWHIVFLKSFKFKVYGYSLRCHFAMSMFFRFDNTWWCCLTKSSIFFRLVLFFCVSDAFLSENLTSELYFSTILAG